MIIPYRDDNPWKRPPVITYSLILLNVLVSAALWHVFSTQGEAGVLQLYHRYGLLPAKLELRALITYAFLHAGILHLAFNMLFLWIFGDNVEDSLGSPLFLGFYLIGAAFAGLMYATCHQGAMTPCIGASGAVSAVLGAYVVLYPEKKVHILVWLFIVYIRVFRVRALAFVAFWFAVQIVLFFFELNPAGEVSVAYSAHLGGFLFGFLTAVLLRLTVVRVPAHVPTAEPKLGRRRYEELGRPGPFSLQDKEVTYRPRPGARLRTARLASIPPSADEAVHTADELLFEQEAQAHRGELYSVIRTGDEDVDLFDLLPVISTAAQIPRVDISHMIRKTHGFVLMDVDMARAQNVVYRLKMHGISTLTIRQDRLVPLPAPLFTRQVTFGTEGIRAEGKAQAMTAPWEDVALAASGWIEQRVGGPKSGRVNRPTTSALALGPLGPAVGYESDRAYSRYDAIASQPRQRKAWVIDLVLVNPWRRIHCRPEGIRLSHGPASAGGQTKKAELVIEKLLEYTDNSALNVVLHDILESGKHIPSGRFTFSSDHAFDGYVFWLLQVKTFVGDISRL